MKVLLVGEGASELAGALETLVRRLGLSNAVIDQDRVSQQGLHAHHGKGPGYFKRAVRWMLEAHKRGYDALILVIDEDGLPERSQQFAAAQQSDVTGLRRALGVAIQSFDAWMLADEQALTTVLSRQVPRQPEPEKIGDPKLICAMLLAKSEGSLNPVEMYAQVAVALSLDILRTRCPKGFEPFARRVAALTE